MEERLTHLETQIAYQDQIIEDLNQVVIELRQKVEELEKLCISLKDQNSGSHIKDPSLEVPPPHY